MMGVRIMQKIQINHVQLFCTMVLFLFGTAILLNIGSGAKQDAWIVTLISPLFGILLFCLYFYIYRKYPDKPLTSYVQVIWGKYIGSVVSFLYILYFIYIASRILRDFEELLVVSPYFRTSIITIGICIIFVLIYAVSLGFEVISRVATMCFGIIVIFFITLDSMFVLGGYLHFENILPVLSEGWKPVFKEIFPLNITVPYGELITFTMIFPYLNDRKKGFKYGIVAIILCGLYFTISALQFIFVLGPDVIIRSSFPALTAVAYIDIGDFVQRLDTLVIILMVVLGFIKLAVFFYCAVLGVNQLFSINPHPFINCFVGGMILLFSLVITQSYQDHIEEGLNIVPFYIHLPFQIIIPIMLLLTIIMKEKVIKRLS